MFVPGTQAPENQQLFKNQVLLEDAKKLADLKVENDDVIALCFMKEGVCACACVCLTVSEMI